MKIGHLREIRVIHYGQKKQVAKELKLIAKGENC